MRGASSKVGLFAGMRAHALAPCPPAFGLLLYLRNRIRPHPGSGDRRTSAGLVYRTQREQEDGPA